MIHNVDDDEGYFSHEYTSEIVCPHCGYEFSDSWECGDEGEHQCPECKGRFRHTRNCEITYSTEAIQPKGDAS